MQMYISESSQPKINSHTPMALPRVGTDDAAATESASIAVSEAAQNYENLREAKEKRDAIFNQNPQDPMLFAAQTAVNKTATALWASVNKNESELSEDLLALYNAAIESASSYSASSTASEEDTFSVNNATSGRSRYIDAHKDAAEDARIRLNVMLMLQSMGLSAESVRTLVATLTNANKEGVDVGFPALITKLKKIILDNDGQHGLPGKGIVKDKDGNNIVFKDKAAADKYANDNYGPLVKSKAVLDANGQPTGEYVVSLDIQPLKDLQKLFEDELVKQSKGHLTREEHTAFETALRGIFAVWDGNVSTASQLASQRQQGFDTLNKLLSTLMSNEDEEATRMMSRL